MAELDDQKLKELHDKIKGSSEGWERGAPSPLKLPEGYGYFLTLNKAAGLVDDKDVEVYIRTSSNNQSENWHIWVRKGSSSKEPQFGTEEANHKATLKLLKAYMAKQLSLLPSLGLKYKFLSEDQLLFGLRRPIARHHTIAVKDLEILWDVLKKDLGGMPNNWEACRGDHAYVDNLRAFRGYLDFRERYLRPRAQEGDLKPLLGNLAEKIAWNPGNIVLGPDAHARMRHDADKFAERKSQYPENYEESLKEHGYNKGGYKQWAEVFVLNSNGAKDKQRKGAIPMASEANSLLKILPKLREKETKLEEKNKLLAAFWSGYTKLVAQGTQSAFYTLYDGQKGKKSHKKGRKESHKEEKVIVQYGNSEDNSCWQVGRGSKYFCCPPPWGANKEYVTLLLEGLKLIRKK